MHSLLIMWSGLLPGLRSVCGLSRFLVLKRRSRLVLLTFCSDLIEAPIKILREVFVFCQEFKDLPIKLLRHFCSFGLEFLFHLPEVRTLSFGHLIKLFVHLLKFFSKPCMRVFFGCFHTLGKAIKTVI